jgi:diaminopimelate decarboxylase
MARQLYEKPTIVKHSVGLMNKFGRPPGSVPYGKIDGVAVTELLARHGSPLWVVSEGTLRRKIRDLKRSFELRYPKVQISYSYKTNYLSAVCAILHQEGAIAEVVSGFEYDMAIANGVDGHNIVFNGPHKTRMELERAIEAGAKVNIDSYDEMYLLEEIARAKGRTLDIGMRVNVDVNYPPWDRFGFNYESGQAYEAVKRAMSGGLLRIVGLHCHIGTYILDVNMYKKSAESLVSFAALVRDHMNVRIEYIDLGGGFASRNTLHSMWLPGEQACPTFDQYAEVICPALLRGSFNVNEQPMLMLEPGRCIVDEAMYLLASVVSVKRMSNGQKTVVIDAGVNVLPTAWWYKHDLAVAQETGGQLTEDVNIVGPLCMQIDVIRTGIALPPLRKGDTVIVKNVGAYNFSQSMQFIQPRPAVVLVNDGAVEVVRQKETLDYIKHLEKVPARLKGKTRCVGPCDRGSGRGAPSGRPLRALAAVVPGQTTGTSPYTT